MRWFIVLTACAFLAGCSGLNGGTMAPVSLNCDENGCTASGGFYFPYDSLVGGKAVEAPRKLGTTRRAVVVPRKIEASKAVPAVAPAVCRSGQCETLNTKIGVFTLN